MPPVNPLTDTRPIIAVCAATGRQGSSVVDWLCSDGSFRIRGLTRNPDKPEARLLEERGVDVFQVDFDHYETLVSAFTGVFGVYAVTDWFEVGDGERQQGLNIVNAAIKANVQHFIWSTAEHNEHKIPYYETKADVADYLATTQLSYTLLRPSFYFSNLFMMGIAKLNDGSVRVGLPWPSDGPIAMFDSADTGAFALLIFKDPQNFRRQRITLSSGYITPRQIATTYEEVSGCEVELLEMGMEDFLAFDQDQYPFGAWVWLNLKLLIEEAKSGGRDRDPSLARKHHPNMRTLREYLRERLEAPRKPWFHVYMVREEIVVCDYEEGWMQYTGDGAKVSSTVSTKNGEFIRRSKTKVEQDLEGLSLKDQNHAP